MNGLRETCHCSHDKSSHYREHGNDSAIHATCLARGCECRLYTNEFDPKPKPEPKPVFVLDDDSDYGPPTPRTWNPFWP